MHSTLICRKTKNVFFHFTVKNRKQTTTKKKLKKKKKKKLHRTADSKIDSVVDLLCTVRIKVQVLRVVRHNVGYIM